MGEWPGGRSAPPSPRPPFRGTSHVRGPEQFRGTGASGQQADAAVNLRVVFRGASPDGHRLSVSLKMRVRAAQDRVGATVDSCHVQ